MHYDDLDADKPTAQLQRRIPIRFRSDPWSGFDATGDRAKAKVSCQKWAASVAAGHPSSLWLVGLPGRGKTQMAYWTALELAKSGTQVVAHEASVLVTRLRESYAADGNHVRRALDEAIADACAADVLLLDDLGSELASATADDVRALLYRLVNTRWEHNRPTIITSNATTEQLAALGLDQRIVSRLSSYFTVTVSGPDFRSVRK